MLRLISFRVLIAGAGALQFAQQAVDEIGNLNTMVGKFEMMQTVVLGLGNLVHADDGVGVHAIHGLQFDPRVPVGVVLLDGGTQGLALLPHISGVGRLLVIDAMDTGEPPGTLLRFEGKALRGLPGKASVHQLGFADLMVALELLGESPGEVVVLGVQPESTEWSAELTPPVAGSLTALIDCAIAQLKSWEETSA